MESSMTHYMALIMGNQPWNLIIFMAIPVILAETLTVTEFTVLFSKGKNSTSKKINRFIGLVGGLYFTPIFIYLLTTVAIPLTINGKWNTWVDVIAVGFYLIRILFLLPISLMEMGLIFKNKSDEEKRQIHFKLIVGFLIVAHISMIFGMLNPDVVRMTSSMGNMPM
jgi:hypothetical protein